MATSSPATEQRDLRIRALKRWANALIVAAASFELGVLLLAVFDSSGAWKQLERPLHAVAGLTFLAATATRLFAFRVNPLWSFLLLFPGLSRFVPSDVRDAVE
jgi:hypothetical protein